MKKKTHVIAKTLLLTILFVFTVGSLHAQSAGERVNTRLTDIKLLQIGDSIPKALWNLPLKIINHPKGKDTITLNYYRDKKLILLDFWATWCSPCVKGLPRLLALEDSIECKVVPLTDEPTIKITNFLANNDNFQNAELYIYTRGSIIDKSFERYSIPHTVVIYDGLVKSFTLPELLSRDKLNNLVLGNKGNLIPKIDLKHSKDDLLTFAFQDTSKRRYTGFSILLPHMGGIVPGVQWEPKLSDGGSRFQIANYPLLDIIALATGRGKIFLKNPNKIRVQDIHGIREIEPAEWNLLKTIKLCYEGSYSHSLSYSEAISKLRQDLSSYKNINCRIETLSSKIVKFIKKRDLQIEPTKFRYKMSEIGFIMNQIPRGFSMVFKESQADESIYLIQELTKSAPDAVEKSLLEQGWSRTVEHTNEEHLVVSLNGLVH